MAKVALYHEPHTRWGVKNKLWQIVSGDEMIWGKIFISFPAKFDLNLFWLIGPDLGKLGFNQTGCGCPIGYEESSGMLKKDTSTCNNAMPKVFKTVIYN